MATVTGLKKLTSDLNRLGRDADRFDTAGAVVGYSAHYAIYVHEDLVVSHPIHKGHNCAGQAKFLEQPARQNSQQIMNVVIDDYLKNNRPSEAFVKGGRLLRQMSRELVPVDTGELKKSAYVSKIVNGVEKSI